MPTFTRSPSCPGPVRFDAVVEGLRLGAAKRDDPSDPADL